ncbi:Ras family protein [Necator americanus]|uniref:Ras family protein n=1 Tax=Necator americanus TaxID=51031 RepID=W2SXH7_NECAM|nr:Ras family protein [Necator americanus]ETN74320.1 Ras family protein [Necator americanus]
MLRASRRRARFSVTGPEIIVDGPGSSLEALPTTSRENSYRSLSSLPQVDNSASRDDRMDPTVAIRRRSSRNSHDSWSGRMGQLYSVHDSENHDTASTTGFKTVQARHQRFVIDLIDAEFEDDHSIAHTSYMRAADAAILLYSTTDSASLLMAMSIHRQLVAVSEQRKPCVLFANVIEDAAQRYVTREMGERTARNIRAMYIEANLLAQDGGVFAAVEHLCRAVVSNRKNSDGNHICTVM